MSDPFDGLFGDLPAAAAAAAPSSSSSPSSSAKPQAAAAASAKTAGAATEKEAGGGAGGSKKRKQGEGQEDAGDGGGDAAAAGTKSDGAAAEGGGGEKGKRAKTETEGEEGGSGGSSKTEGRMVDLKAALQRIAGAMKSSKPEKFRKACELLLKLLADMDEASCGLFHAALATVMADAGAWDRLVASPEDRALSERIFAVVQQRILLFDPLQQYRAATWVLLGGIRVTLAGSDDSYEFRRAVKQLKEYVQCLQPFAAEESYADKERRRAVLACLDTALKRALVFAWAKPSVEDVFALATERRMSLPEEDREALDEMSTTLRTRQRASALNTTGTVVSRSVRMAESMSTPWNRKATDIYR